MIYKNKTWDCNRCGREIYLIKSKNTSWDYISANLKFWDRDIDTRMANITVISIAGKIGTLNMIGEGYTMHHCKKTSRIPWHKKKLL